MGKRLEILHALSQNLNNGPIMNMTVRKPGETSKNPRTVQGRIRVCEKINK